MDAARLFEEHHAALFRYLVRLTGDADVAHDAAQEAFTRLIAQPPRDESPRAWLFTVAPNLVRGGGKSRTRRLELLHATVPAGPAADPQPDPEQLVEASERRTAIRAALAELTDKEREILLMREEGFSHKEIAEAVGTTTGSVGTMVARALDKLATALPLDAEAL
ncbi:MAG: sigma-70 family RNA polymerase sigma factor [Gemmatimonadetes bacterium]|nr:sigma-70 family RNA polymerase sigma factor [Gemmatimonadota bacterium]